MLQKHYPRTHAVSTWIAVGTALWFASGSAHALGFGRITNLTQLGQPLNFAASVRLDADEQLPRECVSGEVISGENKLASGQVRVTLEGSGDSLDRSVRITTSALIDEPVVTVSVTLGCVAKVTRKFVVFIDPPLINAPQTAAVEVLPPQRNDSQVSSIVGLVQGDSAPAAPSADAASAPRARPRNPAPAPAFASGSRAPAPRAITPRRPAAATRQPPTVQPAASGPRLKLEAATNTAAQSASAPASSPLTAIALAVAEAASAARAEAAASEAAAQLARERQRLQLLEQGLAQLRADSLAQQKSLLELQARLKTAESERYANPMVYALAWLSALLALAVAGLWWRQSRARSAGQWWVAPPAQPPAPPPSAASVREAAAAAEVKASAPVPLGSSPALADAFAMSTVIEDDEPHARSAPVTRPAPAFSPTFAPETESPRELSVEELIDLEQQAEFFVVLGQDDAAIELLMSHVRSDGGISPLPYLKLLEIYRRRGEREAYERIRERFNRRFNAYAPDWDADLQQGRALADYPDTLVRLQALWANPGRVMETLDASLFRRNKSDETFDLPAYRELLFLYSVSRDLAEHGGAASIGNIDLLLPFDEVGSEPISRLVATTSHGELPSADPMTLALDLDVSFGLPDGPSAHEPVSNRSHPATTIEPGPIDFDLDEPVKPPKGPSGDR